MIIPKLKLHDLIIKNENIYIVGVVFQIILNYNSNYKNKKENNNKNNNNTTDDDTTHIITIITEKRKSAT